MSKNIYWETLENRKRIKEKKWMRKLMKNKKPTTLDMLKEFTQFTRKKFNEIKNLYERKLIEETEKNINKWDDEILDKRVLVKLRNIYDESEFLLNSKKFNSMWFLYFSKDV